MNFPYINSKIGPDVHIWGCSEWVDHEGVLHRAYVPVKLMYKLTDKAREITLVYQQQHKLGLAKFEAAKILG